MTSEGLSERKGLLFMGISSLSFGLMGALVKLASITLPFHEVTFFRAFGGFVLIAAWAVIGRVPLHAQDKPLLIWRGVVGWAALMSYFYAISEIPLANAVLLNYTSPFFTAILAAFLLGERFTLRVAGSLFAASLGVAFVVTPIGTETGFWGSFREWGALAALASGFFAAMAYVAVKRATQRNSPWVIVLVFSLVASLLSGPFMIADYRPPSLFEWGILGGVAVTATLAQVLMTYGYRHARASTASTISLLTPLVAALLGILAFGDVPSWGTWLGGAMIIGAGIALASRPPKSL